MRTWKFSLLAAAATIVSACSDASVANAPTNLAAPASRLGTVVTKVPGDDDPGPPFYAISGNGGFLPHTDAWVAIPFDRTLGCVPAGANLLTIDVPAAFGCPMTVSGHAHWETGPGIDIAPRQSSSECRSHRVRAVVRGQAATADGVLTLRVAGASSAVIGTATDYKKLISLESQAAGAGRYVQDPARGTPLERHSFSVRQRVPRRAPGRRDKF